MVTQPIGTELGRDDLTTFSPCLGTGDPLAYFPSPPMSPAPCTHHPSQQPFTFTEVHGLGSGAEARMWFRVSLRCYDLPVPSGDPRKWQLFKSPVTTPPTESQVSVSSKATGCSESLAWVGSRGWNFLT